MEPTFENSTLPTSAVLAESFALAAEMERFGSLLVQQFGQRRHALALAPIIE